MDNSEQMIQSRLFRTVNMFVFITALEYYLVDGFHNTSRIS